MDAWKLLTDATIKAILLIAKYKKIDIEDKNTEISESLKSVVKERIPAIMGEWVDAVESRLGKAWLEKVVNAQANELAILTLKHMGVYDTGYHCLICAETFAGNGIDGHIVEEHPESLGVFPEFDVEDLPFVELI